MTSSTSSGKDNKNRYEPLKLKNQLCFPLYAASKEIVRHYKPILDELELTYTQYIVMLVLWEEDPSNVKHIGERLFLDSGTLTPVLKSLEAKGYLTRKRSEEDERVLEVKLTSEGQGLRDRALKVPEMMKGCTNLSPAESMQLYRLLHKMLGDIDDLPVS